MSKRYGRTFRISASFYPQSLQNLESFRQRFLPLRRLARCWGLLSWLQRHLLSWIWCKLPSRCINTGLMNMKLSALGATKPFSRSIATWETVQLEDSRIFQPINSRKVMQRSTTCKESFWCFKEWHSKPHAVDQTLMSLPRKKQSTSHSLKNLISSPWIYIYLRIERRDTRQSSSLKTSFMKSWKKLSVKINKISWQTLNAWRQLWRSSFNWGNSALGS